jgi:hypothetical protein
MPTLLHIFLSKGKTHLIFRQVKDYTEQRGKVHTPTPTEIQQNEMSLHDKQA